MYLMQIVAYHTGRCGAKVSDVVRTAEAAGTSELMIRMEIADAIRAGTLRYVRCDCK